MKRQNQKPGNSNEKPGEPGVSGDAAPVPVEGSSSKGGEGVAGGVPGRRRSRRTSIGRIPTNELERLYGKSKGGNRDIEDELRRRGHNSKMLTEAEWGHDQRRWRDIAQKAHEVSSRRKKGVRRAKLKRKRDRRHQRSQESLRKNRMDLLARLKEGVEIVGENYDPAAADETCPF